jgi:AcrR family transcriptional regulator
VTASLIAAAAEVSPSTFFRYFSNEEDVMLFDATDPLMFASFEAQLPDLTVIEALRRSFHEVHAALAPAERERERERGRQALIRSVPDLRARMLDDFRGVFLTGGGADPTDYGKTFDETPAQLEAGLSL